MKQHSPSASRNKQPILTVLERWLPPNASVLEIASGSGEHAVHMTGHMPKWQWQPTDINDEAIASITTWQSELNRPNLLPPIKLDASATWSIDLVDAIICINMTQVSPIESTANLFKNAVKHLKKDGLLIFYSPLRLPNQPLSPGNQAFDESLQANNNGWCLKSVEDLDRFADSCGMTRKEIIAMPANNHMLVYGK